VSLSRFNLGGLSVPKKGADDSTCEDALKLYHSELDEEGLVAGPIAIAMSDGASESMLAREWAWRIVKRLGRRAFKDIAILNQQHARYFELVSALKLEWESFLVDYFEWRNSSDRPVQWYEQPKLEAGASATVLVFRLDNAMDSRICYWQAVALGDTCIFHVRDDEIIRRFPVSEVAEFSTAPDLLRSRGSDAMQSCTQFAGGACDVGDEFFLMTDAMAKWFLLTSEADEERFLP